MLSKRHKMSETRGTPYGDVAGIRSGVRCDCQEDYYIGRPADDPTPGGNPSKKKLRTMAQCWEAWRKHWAAEHIGQATTTGHGHHHG